MNMKPWSYKKFLGTQLFDQNDIKYLWDLPWDKHWKQVKRTHFLLRYYWEKYPTHYSSEICSWGLHYNVCIFQKFWPQLPKEYQVYATKDVDKIELPGLWMELVKYFDQLEGL